MSADEQALTDSIKALKTLSFRNGRVSIQPGEVLGQPGYEEARRRAADLVRQPAGAVNPNSEQRRWGALECDDLAIQIARHLRQSHAAGMSYAQALRELQELASSGHFDE